ncbi:COQ9 family protein [Elioraea sp. Yellowstone]|jgi:ubiquinone biosynthesis protein COQ9|uniref:COQ9 family protein n=1 Tax=Elioraea sp. Yellowstone TaxID=2592070 RepID=UPI001153E29B|nr:COQ9 family protein [Elioraea sp. Yellowstone]TQF83090.1 COQ9 family protein [Elioraea sp. Yellowstone]
MGGIERSEERDRAVEAALPHVPLDGWTRKALRAGLADAGFDPADLPLLFPGGPVEAIEVWCDLADRRMAEAVGGLDLAAMRVRDRVAAAIRIRLEQNAGAREAAARATALLALPHNAPAAARITARTVDAIWRAIGDRSADFSWYTKRASLAAIYGATMLYWLRDDSEGAEETLRFLDRRIEALMLIPKAQRRLGEIAARLPDPFGLLARLRRA